VDLRSDVLNELGEMSSGLLDSLGVLRENARLGELGGLSMGRDLRGKSKEDQPQPDERQFAQKRMATNHLDKLDQDPLRCFVRVHRSVHDGGLLGVGEERSDRAEGFRAFDLLLIGHVVDVDNERGWES
jgi:hypothetical protein